MSAVDAELTAGGAGGPLAAESLANVLAVHLIRHLSAPSRTARRPDGALPRGRLRAVVEYVEEHLDAGPTLEHMAAVAHLSAYHFARQFKAATGLPPHQYVILRRVERTKQLLQAGTDLSLAEVALNAGFSDQSTITRHFTRLVAATPRQFRTPARRASRPQAAPRSRGASPLPCPRSRVVEGAAGGLQVNPKLRRWKRRPVMKPTDISQAQPVLVPENAGLKQDTAHEQRVMNRTIF